MTFTWDPKKNQTNIKKKRISFTTAKILFTDPNPDIEFDVDHFIYRIPPSRYPERIDNIESYTGPLGTMGAI